MSFSVSSSLKNKAIIKYFLESLSIKISSLVLKDGINLFFFKINLTNFFNTFFVFALFSFCLIFCLFYMSAFLWLLAFDLFISYYFLHSFFSKKHFLSFGTTHPPYSSECKNAQITLLQAHSPESLMAKGFCKLGYKFLSFFGTKVHKKIQIILVNRFTLLHNLMIKRINYTIPRSAFTFRPLFFPVKMVYWYFYH